MVTFPNPKFLPLGDSALLVEYGDEIDPAINRRVQALRSALDIANIPGVREIVPTFRSLSIHFIPYVTDHKALVDIIQSMNIPADATPKGGKFWTFPFCADEDFAPDLEFVAQHSGLEKDSLLQTFCSSILSVFFLGFVPGNAFLGQLPPSLHVSRRREPRVRIPSGSVATAMGLGMIYPLESPGGWHLIGHSPIPLFDLKRDTPAILSPSDKVQFKLVDRVEHDALAQEIQAGMDLSVFGKSLL